MLDLQEINDTIKELENASTTFDNCMKLANLYIVREHLNVDYRPSTADDNGIEQAVVKEYSDILPAYTDFCKTKRRYQLNEIAMQPVLRQLHHVCSEIVEFIEGLYNNTDTPEERQQITQMISQLKDMY